MIQDEATKHTHRSHGEQSNYHMRKAYKVTQKLAKMKTRRIFLLKCKHQKLCPTFLNFKTEHIIFRCKYLTKRFETLRQRFVKSTLNLLITDTRKLSQQLNT